MKSTWTGWSACFCHDTLQNAVVLDYNIERFNNKFSYTLPM